MNEILHMDVEPNGTGSMEYLCTECGTVISAGIRVSEYIRQENDGITGEEQ